MKMTLWTFFLHFIEITLFDKSMEQPILIILKGNPHKFRLGESLSPGVL
ncbi:hypothetical protein QG37_07457 [Candidozyma auris]|uniref:Uncharacterized protein n=1 Tax=Candidozyma auris TaxID=498019 RepID=A0A0L0NQB3_CANAR|nr:hypothetical protein QG37_07457 [[Candida] auris]